MALRKKNRKVETPSVAVVPEIVEPVVEVVVEPVVEIVEVEVEVQVEPVVEVAPVKPDFGGFKAGFGGFGE